MTTTQLPRTPEDASGDAPRSSLVVAADGSVSIGGMGLDAVIAALARLGERGDPALGAPGSAAATAAAPPSASGRHSHIGELGLSARQLGEVLESLRRLQCAIAATEVRAVEALDRAVRTEARAANGAQEDRIAARETSMATRISPARASARLASSRRLVRSMPCTLRALASGQISPDQAHAIGRAIGPVATQEQRAHIDERLAERFPHLEHAGARRLEHEVSALLHASDPSGGAARHIRAKARRSVTLTPRAHGMATLSATLPALDAGLARKRLSLEAERLHASGDRRGHQAIMADLLADALIGRGSGMDPVTLDIGVIITERSLFAPEGDDAAHLEGYGPVAPHMVRHELARAREEPEADGGAPSRGGAWKAPGGAADGPANSPAIGASDPYGPDGSAMRAALRRLYTHPTTGELVAVESRARAFPRALARFVRWRDQDVCAAPYCDAPIRQIDHIRPVAEGGRTTLDNGQGLCAGCNAKERDLRGAAVSPRGADGHPRTVTWESIHGRRAQIVTPAADPRVIWSSGRDGGAGARGDSRRRGEYTGDQRRSEYAGDRRRDGPWSDTRTGSRTAGHRTDRRRDGSEEEHARRLDGRDPPGLDSR